MSKTGTHMPPGQVSSSVKHWSVLQRMVDNNIPEAIIFEDDVVLHKDFAQLCIPKGLMFCKLGIGVNFEIEPSMDPMSIGNFGGCEATYVTLEFAKKFLSFGVHFGHSVEIVYQAFLMDLRYPLVCIPACHQTSLLDSTSQTGNHSEAQNWIEYIRNWSRIQKYAWKDLIDEFAQKSVVEDEFERTFGKRITMTNAHYINNRLSKLA
jgi:hypothetical protein